MAGNKAGGLKAAATNKIKHGSDFYSRIGSLGGRNGKGPDYRGGFANLEVGVDGLTGPQRAKKAGALGGAISRRGPANKEDK